VSRSRRRDETRNDGEGVGDRSGRRDNRGEFYENGRSVPSGKNYNEPRAAFSNWTLVKSLKKRKLENNPPESGEDSREGSKLRE
jgi:hypothetical protein